MKKLSVILFILCLTLGLVLTCIFGMREIGSDLFKFVKNEKEGFSLDSVDRLFSTVDGTLSDNFVLHGGCIDIYGLVQKLEGRTTVYDADKSKTVTKGTDGKLYFVSNVLDETGGDDNLEERLKANAGSLEKLKKICDENGAVLLYVDAPGKYDTSIVTSSADKLSDPVAKSSYFEKMLNENDVASLNLTQAYKNEFDSYTDGFFITDHHWTIKTAFWGFQKICQKLNSLDGFEKIDGLYFDSDSYETVTIPDCYLGSMGVRVGKYFAGMDDMDIIFPKFDTKFEVCYETKTLGKTVKESGDFKKVIHGDKPEYYYITSDNSEVFVDNLLINNGHKVLLVKDSFGVPVSGWLSCLADELTILDLRYEQKKTLYDYITDNEIDTVIVLYHSDMMGNTSMFNFDGVSSGY